MHIYIYTYLFQEINIQNANHWKQHPISTAEGFQGHQNNKRLIKWSWLLMKLFSTQQLSDARALHTMIWWYWTPSFALHFGVVIVHFEYLCLQVTVIVYVIICYWRSSASIRLTYTYLHYLRSLHMKPTGILVNELTSVTQVPTIIYLKTTRLVGGME